MADVHQHPWRGGLGMERPAAPQTEELTERRPHRGRKVAGAVAVLLGAALAVGASAGSKGSSSQEKGDSARGAAPAAAPGKPSKSPFQQPTTGAAGQGGGGVASPEAVPTVHYDSSAPYDCTGLAVTKKGDTLHIVPRLTKQGNPDPSRFYTVVDWLASPDGSPAADPTDHKVYTARGYGAAVDLPVPAKLDWKQESALVTVVQYPSGLNLPKSDAELSISATGTNRVSAACGNAVVTWALETGQMTVPR